MAPPVHIAVCGLSELVIEFLPAGVLGYQQRAGGHLVGAVRCRRGEVVSLPIDFGLPGHVTVLTLARPMPLHFIDHPRASKGGGGCVFYTGLAWSKYHDSHFARGQPAKYPSSWCTPKTDQAPHFRENTLSGLYL
jgi:hypothetical protein